MGRFIVSLLDTERIEFKLPDRLLARLNTAAAFLSQSRSEFIREAIRQYLHKLAVEGRIPLRLGVSPMEMEDDNDTVAGQESART